MSRTLRIIYIWCFTPFWLVCSILYYWWTLIKWMWRIWNIRGLKLKENKRVMPWMMKMHSLSFFRALGHHRNVNTREKRTVPSGESSIWQSIRVREICAHPSFPNSKLRWSLQRIFSVWVFITSWTSGPRSSRIFRVRRHTCAWAWSIQRNRRPRVLGIIALSWNCISCAKRETGTSRVKVLWAPRSFMTAKVALQCSLVFHFITGC